MSFHQAIKKTVERFQLYKAENSFAEITANANQTDLFNALNQKQGEEKFEVLQSSAQQLLQNIESIYYSQNLTQLTEFINKAKSSQSLFLKNNADFADMPTRLALKGWYKKQQEIGLFDLTTAENKMRQQIKNISNTESITKEIAELLTEIGKIEKRLSLHILQSLLNAGAPNFVYWSMLLLLILLLALRCFSINLNFSPSETKNIQAQLKSQLKNLKNR